MNLKRKWKRLKIPVLFMILFLLITASFYMNGRTGTGSERAELPVMLVIKGRGYIRIGNKSYKTSQEIKVSRKSEDLYRFIPEKGWEIRGVWYGTCSDYKKVNLRKDYYKFSEIGEKGSSFWVVFGKKRRD